MKEHTLVSFWHYILITELARKALDHDRAVAAGDAVRWQRYQELESQYLSHDPGGDFDFSQRLLMQAERVTARLKDVAPDQMSARITEMFYSGTSKALGEAVRQYFRTKDSVWVLIDNIDKGWPVKGASTTDILIVRALLEATRKLQHELGGDEVEFDCLVFLRSDIYENLREDTPDKGKDTAIRLDWEDPAVFAEIVRLRIEASTELTGSLSEIWPVLCTPLVDGQESFSYITDRTLMRPRDLLQFVRHAVQTAINRGHARVEEEDVKFAEAAYSEDLLLATAFEIADTKRDLADALYVFEGSEPEQSVEDVRFRIEQSLPAGTDADEVIELLIWYGVLGVLSYGANSPRYAYQVQGNLSRLYFPLKQDGSKLVIHPAFRTALSVSD